MKTRAVQCPGCFSNLNVTVGEQIGGKLSFALGGAILGGQAMKSPVAVLVFGLAGLLMGHLIDTEINTACPQCGQLIKIAGTVSLFS